MIVEKEKFIVNESIPLIDALKILNETGKRIIFLENNGVLKGVLTYGDVSRWILKGGNLDSPSIDAATINPITINSNNIKNANDVFVKTKVSAAPVIDDDNKIVDILFEEEHQRKFEQINIPVVIMAGGKGTRLYPYTKILPKPLIPIGEIPISEHIINRFCANGCRDYYFIVNYKKNMIKAYFNEIERDYNVYFVDEDIPYGTGGGLRLIKNTINTTFILTNCDSFIDEDYSKILEFHKSRNNKVTMICSNQRFEVPYGVVKTSINDSLIEMQEKPSFEYLTNTGTYIVEPEVVNLIRDEEVIGFPDVIQRVVDSGDNVGVYTVEDGSWLDMGQFDTMEEMKKRLDIID